MDKTTEMLLKKDTIAETESLLGGKHWSEFSDLENKVMLFNAFRDGENKSRHLEAIGDTYFSISWPKFIELIKSNGFVEALSYDFIYDNGAESAVIYYSAKKGLVIWATSIGNKSRINGGNLYGEIKANDKTGEGIIWNWISTGGCIDSTNRIFSTQQDIREGLFSKLSALESGGTFLPTWVEKDCFLWFVDYVETKTIGYDYRKITQDKIRKCPKELLSIVGKEVLE